MTRRKLFPLLATAPFFHGCGRETEEKIWKGVLFNNPVSVRYRSDHDHNDAIAERVQKLESIFSLYDPSSEIVRLNSTGSAASPSKELLILLEKCRTYHQLSQGAFDPSIQSYWSWLNEQNQLGQKPTKEEKEGVLEQVDFRRIEISSSGIQLNGVKLTLNSVSQGFATDQVAKLLLSQGVTFALVNLGEFRALGGPFDIQVNHPSASHRVLKSIALEERSLAVSSGSGHRLSAAGKDNHLLSPFSGQSPPALRTVVTQAPDATTADAWATILSLKPDLASVLPVGVKGEVFPH